MLFQTLHTFKGNFRAFKILIAAGYNGVNIEWKEVDAKKAGALSPAGRLPVLETPEGALSAYVFHGRPILSQLFSARDSTYVRWADSFCVCVCVVSEPQARSSRATPSLVTSPASGGTAASTDPPSSSR